MLEKKPATKSSNIIPNPFFIFLSIKPIGNGLVISNNLKRKKLTTNKIIIFFSNNSKFNGMNKREINTKLCPKNSSITISLASFFLKLFLTLSIK